MSAHETTPSVGEPLSDGVPGRRLVTEDCRLVNVRAALDALLADLARRPEATVPVGVVHAAVKRLRLICGDPT